MAKKQHHEEHENHERWLVSYADFITLLFAFFVVMYSVSRVDNKRMAQVVNSIKFALHFEGTGGVDALPLFEGPPSEGGCIAQTGTGAKIEPVPKNKQIAEHIRQRVQKRLDTMLMNRPDLAKSVIVQTEGKRLVVRLSAARFFDPAHAAIRPEMIPVLDVIASEMVAIGRPLRVEGHTDSSPALGKRFRDNWELSTSRAAAVVSYIERAHQMDGKLLSAVGKGASHPIQDNWTAEGREANRRIDLVVEVGEDGLGVLAR